MRDTDTKRLTAVGGKGEVGTSEKVKGLDKEHTCITREHEQWGGDSL